eukprot:CAMPEP_0201596742 /NCGR_PEP_ID=MMETSP0190_2-20130828/193363_1 /ASSEMBLY_ACC=CAM_ASM_000263 /TAXON_ID=37353 /ORGANISM="Rosalina sp." /LENGTH=357 /DNA_ID=CAMNT_0048057269 /DNA_START=34 /DNA_END=1111 /DNA_ORIENTATION=+
MSNLSNGVVSAASHSNSSMRSDFLGKLGRKNSYICQTLPLSNTNSADSNVSFAVSEEDGLSQGDLTPIRPLPDIKLMNQTSSKSNKLQVHHKKKKNPMRPSAIKVNCLNNVYVEHQMNKSINIDSATELIVDTSIVNELSGEPGTTIVNECDDIVFEVTDIDMIGDPGDDDDEDDEDDDLDVDELAAFMSPRTVNIQQLIKKNQIQSINDDDENDEDDMVVVDYNEDDEIQDNDDEEEEEEDIDIMVKDTSLEDCNLNMLRDLEDLDGHNHGENNHESGTINVGVDENGNIIENDNILGSYTSSESGHLHHAEGGELEFADYDSSTMVSSLRQSHTTNNRIYNDKNESAFHRTGLIF